MEDIQIFTGGIAETNGYLLTLPGGTLLVDAPEGVAQWLRKKKVQVDMLLLTHQHFDHVMDAAAVRKDHNCSVAAWSSYSPDLTLENLFKSLAGSSFAVPAYEICPLLEGEKRFRAGGVEWELLHVPGHSTDSVCFYWAERGLLLGGDVLFQSGVGRTDLPGGSHALLIQGIEEKLLPLPDATRVLPGHGESTTIGEERQGNPFLQ